MTVAFQGTCLVSVDYKDTKYMGSILYFGEVGKWDVLNNWSVQIHQHMCKSDNKTAVLLSSFLYRNYLMLLEKLITV